MRIFDESGSLIGKVSKVIRPKTCKRCNKQYINAHKCEVIETEVENVKKSGRF